MTQNNLKEALKQRKIEAVIGSSEYDELLKQLAQDIKQGASQAANEATVVSRFELELYGFMKEVLGVKYQPNKEELVDTERHIAKGRIDSKIGALVIEFKHPSKLVSSTNKNKASTQLIEYLEGLYKKDELDYLGAITDGTKIKFIRLENGIVKEEAFESLSAKHLDRIIKSVFQLEQVALTPRNLIKNFCEPENDSIVSLLVNRLFRALQTAPTNKTVMLFTEWKELFRLAHDDSTKQQAIEERGAALSEIIGSKISSNEDEYRVLYCLQTAYALIVKIIAFKVISRIRFSKSLIEFNSLAEADHDVLRFQMETLEEGALFRSLGIGNLLEGDFFSWYCTEKQWNSEIAESVQVIFAELTRYEDIALFKTDDNVQDLFKDLYLRVMPSKVRHSLGEYYTPRWLADYVVNEALTSLGQPKNWKGLDPCAGSGTFITAMIKKVLQETSMLSKEGRLRSVLTRVKAVDLNPLTVLTARINYFINISSLVSDSDVFEIPVYLGDASYVPESIFIDKVDCIQYRIQTLKGHIDITIPKSTVNNPELFSKTMTDIEEDIKNQDADAIKNKLFDLVNPHDLTPLIESKITDLASKFVELEKNDWNGIWARIATNFLTTANLGTFDIVVGNPPWIDWKNLPAGYRDRIKSLCISRDLFSGDSVTGGINLNICALIANVSAEKWLHGNGVLAFLMPKSLVFQQSYEGFRKFKLNNGKHLYFQHLTDWSESGHPFHPVQEKFMTYFVRDVPKDYAEGIEVTIPKALKGNSLRKLPEFETYEEIGQFFELRKVAAGQCNTNSTAFTFAENRSELEKFELIAGDSYYIGREGIEFYPQELFLLMPNEDFPSLADKIYLKNFQNKKSKYKIPQGTIMLEKVFLHPLVKGTSIKRFHLSPSEYIVPFPYEEGTPKVPIPLKDLRKASPLLAKFFNKYKSVIDAQTNYNGKIIGDDDAAFYALARVGPYSYANTYVAFRDNTKWQAVVVTEMETKWGGKRRPLFQNHAVSICEAKDGRFITLDEAHFICAILNAPIVEKFILNSSDSRTFKIRPPVRIPQYESTHPLHKKLMELSKEAHQNYSNELVMNRINSELDSVYVELMEELSVE
jgi:hypothetical protein